MSYNKESMQNVLAVAVGVCLVASIVVSGTAVFLKPTQKANKEADRYKNILVAAGLFKEGESWAAANDQSGRWCEGIPAIGNTDSYCGLPVAGRIKASCSD